MIGALITLIIVSLALSAVIVFLALTIYRLLRETNLAIYYTQEEVAKLEKSMKSKKVINEQLKGKEK